MKRIFPAATLIFLCPGVIAMSIFNPTKTCVFSEVRARLTMNGEPLQYAKVTRQWEWHKRKSDEAYTDENGVVSFPAVYESSLTRLLPVEIVIGQELSVSFQGQSVIIWSNSKRQAEPRSEYAGAAFDVTCELTKERAVTRDYGSLMLTMCKLQS